MFTKAIYLNDRFLEGKCLFIKANKKKYPFIFMCFFLSDIKDKMRQGNYS